MVINAGRVHQALECVYGSAGIQIHRIGIVRMLEILTKDDYAKSGTNSDHCYKNMHRDLLKQLYPDFVIGLTTNWFPLFN